MGFQTSQTDTSYPPKIELRVIDHKRFQLMTPFAYLPDEGAIVEVPAHDEGNAKDTTDLASVPSLLWGLLPSYGRQLRAALMHDHLCNLVDERAGTDRSGAAADRHRADDLFRYAMRDPGDKSPADMTKRVSWFRSWVFWADVSYGRFWKFHKLAAVLLTAHVLVGLLALYVVVGIIPMTWASSILPADWEHRRLTYALIYLGTVALSFAWLRTARVPLIGLLIGPIVVPVLIVTFIAQFLTAIPDWLNSRFRPDKEPPANFGPVIAARQRE